MGILNINVINVYIWFLGILLNPKNEIKCAYLFLIHCAPLSDPLCPRGGAQCIMIFIFFQLSIEMAANINHTNNIYCIITLFRPYSHNFK